MKKIFAALLFFIIPSTLFAYTMSDESIITPELPAEIETPELSKTSIAEINLIKVKEVCKNSENISIETCEKLLKKARKNYREAIIYDNNSEYEEIKKNFQENFSKKIKKLSTVKKEKILKAIEQLLVKKEGNDNNEKIILQLEALKSMLES